MFFISAQNLERIKYLSKTVKKQVTSDRVGSSLAIAEIPEELVDPVEPEGSGQNRELHLLLTEQE